MFFDVQNLVKKPGVYPVENKVRAVAHRSLCKAVFADFWNGFSYKLSKIELLPTDSFTFCIGKAPFLPLGGESYRPAYYMIPPKYRAWWALSVVRLREAYLSRAAQAFLGSFKAHLAEDSP